MRHTAAKGASSTEAVIASELTFDPASFKGLEYADWQKGAASYDNLFGSITRHAMEPLLDATDVRAESSVLEVCCGLGFGTGAALSRGARAVGIDFAPTMVEAARERYPAAAFRQDDAEALNFDSGVFDAVICAFGVNHLSTSREGDCRSPSDSSSWRKVRVHDVVVPGKSKFTFERTHNGGPDLLASSPSFAPVGSAQLKRWAASSSRWEP